MTSFFNFALICFLFTAILAGQNNPPEKKPRVYLPLEQAEFAYNLSKECGRVQVTWIPEKADYVLGWGMNEKENRNDWILYTADGKFVSAGETVRVSASARDICNAIK